MPNKSKTKHILITDVLRADLDIINRTAGDHGQHLTYRLRMLIHREAARLARAAATASRFRAAADEMAQQKEKP